MVQGSSCGKGGYEIPKRVAGVGTGTRRSILRLRGLQPADATTSNLFPPLETFALFPLPAGHGGRSHVQNSVRSGCDWLRWIRFIPACSYDEQYMTATKQHKFFGGYIVDLPWVNYRRHGFGMSRTTGILSCRAADVIAILFVMHYLRGEWSGSQTTHARLPCVQSFSSYSLSRNIGGYMWGEKRINAV